MTEEEEEITTFNIKGLASHPDVTGSKGIASRDLVLEIVGKGVTHWYVTTDARFTPSNITDPASVSWNQSDPTGDQNYILAADNVSEGPVILYLWIAGGTGVATKAREETFTLDMTAPTLSAVAIPTDATKLVVGTSNAPFGLTTNETATNITKYEYCFGQNCTNFIVIPNVSDPASVPLNFYGLTAGVNHVIFRVSDWLGNVSTPNSQTFTLTNCTGR